MAKKKKLSPEETHRNLQDNVQALPYMIAQLEKDGKRGQLFLLKYIRGPILRFMHRMSSKQRYAGPEGSKLKQSDQMKRHLEQRQKAMEFYQGEMKRVQQRQAKRQGKKK
ncbi:MAG TPA: hypothetical protein VK420_23235 [Longimicrobium sp.]|nr:hypothetical protein [Longimicrobium sp.]